MHGVTYQIWCQAEFAAQALRTAKKCPFHNGLRAFKLGSRDRRKLLQLGKVTAKYYYISTPFRLMDGAGIASQMNPLAIPTLVESQAVEIQ
jgi:hypothetical protein